MIWHKLDPPPQVSWTVAAKIPPTALWLPIASDLSLEEIGRKAASKILGEDKSKEDLEKFAAIIRKHTEDCRQRQVRKGGIVFFPDFDRLPPIASIDIFRYYSEQPDEPSSLEGYRELFGTPDKDTVGSIDVADVGLPVGPSLRFHNRYWPKVRLPVTMASQHEHVTYAARPAQIKDAVVLTVAWAEFQFSEMLINMADAIARTLEIKLLDA